MSPQSTGTTARAAAREIRHGRCPAVTHRPLAKVRVLAITAMLGGCTFLQTSSTDAYGVDYEALTRRIERAEQLRASGADASAGWELLAGEASPPEGPLSWELVVAELYARRSSASVRDVTYESAAGTMVGWIASDARRRGGDGPGALGFVLAAPLVGVLAAVDVIAAPFWLARAVYCDVTVPHDAVVRAAADIERARDLGYEGDRVRGSGGMTWPRPYHRHVDQLGFDAVWLRSQGHE
jgi:hypothetical protein